MANPKPASRRSPAPDGSAIRTATAAASDGVAATSFLERVQLRRRLAYLRRRRELALRDLGGFVFEEHHQREDRAALRNEKLASLDVLYAELDTLERALRDRQELLVLREPGITACPQCATIHGSEAKFCPNCGTPTSGQPARRRAAGARKR